MPDSSLITPLLRAFLPPDLVTTIDTHILHPDSPLQSLKRQALLQAQRALDTLLPLAQPLLDRALLLMAENQGAVGTAVSLLLVVLVVVVLSWIRRLVMWWTRLTMRVAMWGILVALAAWVWERGVWESVRDVVILGGKVGGYMAVLKEVWLSEYNKYEAQQGMGNKRSGR